MASLRPPTLDEVGLVAMRERVGMAGGRFQVNTRPGAGVTVRAMFRLSPAAQVVRRAARSRRRPAAVR
jgi:signal transduction histidine kinase